MTKLDRETMVTAYLASDPDFNGVFVVAVRTTRIFCRPTCPARKPFPKNVEFFDTGKEALFAGYRPCKRCRPMGELPKWIKPLLDRLEADPAARIKEYDIREMGIEPSRLRRFFKSEYGLTFQAYARGRRLGLAMASLRRGQNVQVTGMDHGYESTSGFREAFERVFGGPPSKGELFDSLTMRWLETPIGAMLAIADAERLCLLEFVDRRMMETQLRMLKSRFKCALVPGTNSILEQLESELAEYFAGTRQTFTLPLDLRGTTFQMEVWEALLKIPFGQLRSYGDQATMIGRPDAQRAVGKANGDNRIAIVVPCHRVIKADGTLCGYGGGLWRKEWLLKLEGAWAGSLDL